MSSLASVRKRSKAEIASARAMEKEGVSRSVTGPLMSEASMRRNIAEHKAKAKKKHGR